MVAKKRCEYLENTVRGRGDDPAALRKLARAQLKLWSITLTRANALRVRDAYEKALSLRVNADQPGLWFEAASVYISMGAYAGAISLLQRIIMDFGDWPRISAVMLAGVSVYRQLGNFDAAASYLEFLLQHRSSETVLSEAELVMEMALTYHMKDAATKSNRSRSATFSPSVAGTSATSSYRSSGSVQSARNRLLVGRTSEQQQQVTSSAVSPGASAASEPLSTDTPASGTAQSEIQEEAPSITTAPLAGRSQVEPAATPHRASSDSEGPVRRKRVKGRSWQTATEAVADAAFRAAYGAFFSNPVGAEVLGSARSSLSRGSGADSGTSSQAQLTAAGIATKRLWVDRLGPSSTEWKPWRESPTTWLATAARMEKIGLYGCAADHLSEALRLSEAEQASVEPVDDHGAFAKRRLVRRRICLSAVAAALRSGNTQLAMRAAERFLTDFCDDGRGSGSDGSGFSPDVVVLLARCRSTRVEHAVLRWCLRFISRTALPWIARRRRAVRVAQRAAATRIQRIVRSRQARQRTRMRYMLETACSEGIQAVARGFLARRYFDSAREEQARLVAAARERRRVAACRIQNVWQRFYRQLLYHRALMKQRSKFRDRIRWAIGTVQSFIRMVPRKCEFGRQRRAARALQQWCRVQLAQGVLAFRLAEMQTMVRGLIAAGLTRASVAMCPALPTHPRATFVWTSFVYAGISRKPPSVARWHRHRYRHRHSPDRHAKRHRSTDTGSPEAQLSVGSTQLRRRRPRLLDEMTPPSPIKHREATRPTVTLLQLLSGAVVRRNQERGRLSGRRLADEIERLVMQGRAESERRNVRRARRDATRVVPMTSHSPTRPMSARSSVLDSPHSLQRTTLIRGGRSGKQNMMLPSTPIAAAKTAGLEPTASLSALLQPLSPGVPMRRSRERRHSDTVGEIFAPQDAHSDYCSECDSYSGSSAGSEYDTASETEAAPDHPVAKGMDDGQLTDSAVEESSVAVEAAEATATDAPSAAAQAEETTEETTEESVLPALQDAGEVLASDVFEEARVETRVDAATDQSESPASEDEAAVAARAEAEERAWRESLVVASSAWATVAKTFASDECDSRVPKLRMYALKLRRIMFGMLGAGNLDEREQRDLAADKLADLRGFAERTAHKSCSSSRCEVLFRLGHLEDGCRDPACTLDQVRNAMMSVIERWNVESKASEASAALTAPAEALQRIADLQQRRKAARSGRDIRRPEQHRVPDAAAPKVVSPASDHSTDSDSHREEPDDSNRVSESKSGGRFPPRAVPIVPKLPIKTAVDVGAAQTTVGALRGVVPKGWHAGGPPKKRRKRPQRRRRRRSSIVEAEAIDRVAQRQDRLRRELVDDTELSDMFDDVQNTMTTARDLKGTAAGDVAARQLRETYSKLVNCALNRAKSGDWNGGGRALECLLELEGEAGHNRGMRRHQAEYQVSAFERRARRVVPAPELDTLRDLSRHAWEVTAGPRAKPRAKSRLTLSPATKDWKPYGANGAPNSGDDSRSPGEVAALAARLAAAVGAPPSCDVYERAFEATVASDAWRLVVDVVDAMSEAGIPTADAHNRSIIRVCGVAPSEERDERMYSALVEAGLPLPVCFAAAPKAVRTNALLMEVFGTFMDDESVA